MAHRPCGRALRRVLAHHLTMGRPLRRMRAGRDGRRVLTASPQPGPNPSATAPQDRAPALEAATGAGPDRRTAGHARLDRPRGPAPLPDQPAVPHRPCHWRAGALPRTRSSRCHAPHRRQELGNVPDGGGWRYVERVQGRRNRATTPDKPRNKYCGPLLETAFAHTVVDDHSRVAYAEIRDDVTSRSTPCTARWPGSLPAP